MIKIKKQFIVSILVLFTALVGFFVGGSMLLPSQSVHIVNASTATPTSTSLARGSSITVPVKSLSITGMSVTMSVGYIISLNLDDSTSIMFTLMPAGTYVSHIVMVNGTSVKSATAKAGSCSITEENNILTFKSAAYTYTYSLSGNAKNVTITNNDIYSASAITVAYNHYSYDVTLQYLAEDGISQIGQTLTYAEGTTISFNVSGNKVTLPGTSLTYFYLPEVYGLNFSHWETISGNQRGDKLTQDTVLRAVYTPETYYVYYNSYSGSTWKVETLEYGTKIPEVETPPAPDGYVFSHWENRSGILNIGDPITGHVVLYPVYASAYCTVEIQYLDVDGVTWISTTLSVAQNSVLSTSISSFPRISAVLGLELIGWQTLTGNELGDYLIQDTVLRANYIAAERTVVYRSNTFAVLETKTLKYGAIIPDVKPPAPAYGYVFSHWHSNAGLTVGDTCTRDVILTAVYTELESYQIRFMLSDSTVLKTLKFYSENSQYLNSEQIPAYTGFIPALYRFSGWRTMLGIFAENYFVTADTDFYPVMEKNFEFGETTQYIYDVDKETYNNDTLAQDFSDGFYKKHADTSIQALADPVVIYDFQIQNMLIPWVIQSTYFTLTLDTKISDFIPSESAYNSNQKTLSLKSYGYTFSGNFISFDNYVYLMYGDVELWKIAFSDFVSNPSNYKSNWLHNQISFRLYVEDASIKWTLNYGYGASKTYSGKLPGVYAYQYDLNSSDKYCLGLVGAYIYRDSTKYSTTHTGGFLGLGVNKTYTYNKFPNIDIKGYYAKIEKAVDFYIDGEYSFTDYLPVNHYKNLTIENDKESTIKWYLDAALTQEMVLNQHTARVFDRLYGKWIPAEYQVTLEYYTIDRFYISENNGLYYDALVKKSKTVIYARDLIINLNDFGTDIYDYKYYDYIKLIPFQGWDKDITAPITGDITIKASYKFPTATLRYYDVDDALFGDVKKEMTVYPVDLLITELNQVTERNELWYHDPEPDKGLFGKIYGFFEGVMRSLFGGDTVSQNAETLKKQQEDSYKIVKQLADSHKTRDNFGVFNEYYLLVVDCDVYLEDLNQGAYGNSAFHVYESKNQGWHALSGSTLSGHISYWVEVATKYSLSSSNFTLIINFDKKMDGFDAFAKTVANASSWLGSFFGGIFSGFFGGLFGNLGWIYTIILLVIGFIVFWFLLRPLFVGICTWLAGLLVGLINKIGGGA